jgi:hypothetical protein
MRTNILANKRISSPQLKCITEKNYRNWTNASAIYKLGSLPSSMIASNELSLRGQRYVSTQYAFMDMYISFILLHQGYHFQYMQAAGYQLQTPPSSTVGQFNPIVGGAEVWLMFPSRPPCADCRCGINCFSRLLCE